MKKNLLKSFKCCLTLSLLMISLQATAETIRLSGHIPSKVVANATLLHRLEESAPIPITFVLPLRNQEELAELIERIHNPSDKLYGKYLTTAEFIERFAPTQEDYDKVVSYANSLGLFVDKHHPNRILLNASCAAKSVESAFNLRLHHFLSPNGQHFYGPSDDPEVPDHIASVIQGVVGLDNLATWKSHLSQKERIDAASHQFPSGPGGGFSPSDLIKAYNLSSVAAKGENQIIALFELASYQASDINAYTNYFGLPLAKLKNILVDGGSKTGIDAEVTLDIELAIALAPESEIYVYEGPNSNQGVLDTYNRIATDNVAKQVSTSWGLGEDLVSAQYLQAENAIFQQMAVQGQTIYAAAGDSGAYDDYPANSSRSLVVDDPASQPYIVGVGGTHLVVDRSTGDYQMESIWNDGLGNGAGGGGVSTVWPIPSWQAKLTTASSTTHRNVPDVALNADTNTGYAIYYNGQWQIYGGTSCAAPLWAAFTALVNQSLAEAKKPPLGFANPILYALANGASFATDFHDVATGNNLGYTAHQGYDNASGWGSFNGAHLFASLTAPTPAPLLNIILKHSASFIKGSTGTYRIVISNIGQAPTSGPVTAAVKLPDGLTYESFSGSGWSFDSSTLTFIENNSLNPGSSYAAIVLNVHVADNAPATLVPSATISGGGFGTMTVQNLTTTR